MMTNRKLQKYFKEFNKEFFDGLLPDIKVIFSDLSEDDLAGAFNFDWDINKNPLLEQITEVSIEIDKGLREYGTYALITLLHEMLHLKTLLRCSTRANVNKEGEHGPIFNEEKRKLILKGAFNPYL